MNFIVFAILTNGFLFSLRTRADSLAKSSSGPKNRSFFGWRGPRGGSLSPPGSMASCSGVLKDYSHSSLNEAFKSQNNVNFKLIKTGEPELQINLNIFLYIYNVYLYVYVWVCVCATKFSLCGQLFC